MNQPRSIAIVGYGSQGKAWAANLRDQGTFVEVILPENSCTMSRAWHDGFPPATANALVNHSLVALLIPDHLHLSFLARYQRFLARGTTLIFASGYSQTFDPSPLRGDIHIGLIAPRLSGVQMRRAYLMRAPITMVVASHAQNQPRRNSALSHPPELLALAQKLAGGYAQCIDSTFREECVANLFSEQAVVCGGLPGLAAAAHQLLLAKGVHPQIAKQDTLGQIAMIGNLIERYGVAGMYERVSVMARLGGRRGARFLVDRNFVQKLEALYQHIASGEFANSISVAEVVQP